MAAVVFPASLFAETNKGDLKGTVNPKLVASWNRTAKNWPTLKTPSEVDREIKKMSISYNPRFETQDQKFIQSLVSQLTDFPVVKVKGDAYECYDKKSGNLLFTAKVLGNNKYSFNGKDFEYDLKSSLESNVNRIKELVSAEEVTFFQQLDHALLPQAQARMSTLAIVALSVGAAILVGSTIYSGGENWKRAGSHTTEGFKHVIKAPASLMGVPE